MIVWLASYPRSGNTLLRLIMKEAFGKFTYSEHNDKTAIGGDRAFSRRVGHATYPMGWEDFYKLAGAKERLYLVKTHHPPRDDAPAVYVIRDGRAAAISYRHYLNSYGKEEKTLRDVILGDAPFGGWGRHVESWDLIDRPNTLLLRYEELVDQPGAAIARLSDFLKLPIKDEPQSSFDELHQKFPSFFRAGRSEVDESEFDVMDQWLFDLIHGPVMDRFGYKPWDGPSADALRAALGPSADERRRTESLEATIEQLQEERKKLNAEARWMRQSLLGGPRDIWRARRQAQAQQRKMAKTGSVPAKPSTV